MNTSAGWLPESVQRIANAATRCGLVPLVEIGHEDSLSLRDHRDVEIAVVAMLGRTVCAYVDTDESDVEPDSVAILGAPRILAWITRRTGCLAS